MQALALNLDENDCDILIKTLRRSFLAVLCKEFMIRSRHQKKYGRKRQKIA